ncbi:MAG: ATP-binding cassette domain-containing protein, partial [Promethearchaeota archaeon]
AIEMVALLNRLHLEENKTILISEHRLEYLIPYAEEILLIENGKLLAHDAIQELLNQDKIYESRIDLPPILQWFKDQKKQGNFLDDIPFKFKDQVKILKAILEKLPNSKSQIKLQSDTLSAIQPEYQPDIQSEPLIDCQNISFNYSTNSRKKSTNYIIDDISFSAQMGEILGIIGPNGAGKSTLIRCLNGLNKPISGKIWLNNEDTNLKPVYELAKDVGIIFQNPDHQLFANSVEEELKFSLKNLSISDEEVKQRISETLSNFRLKEFRKISPFNMSGGQKKRVSLASIACRKTSVIIFDEPTVGQDAAQKAKLREFILKNQQIGHTIIIISHDLEFLASIVSRIIVLINGKIFTEGLPHKILQDQDILQRASLKEPIIGKLLNEIRPDLPFIPKDILTIEEFQEWFASCQ